MWCDVFPFSLFVDRLLIGPSDVWLQIYIFNCNNATFCFVFFIYIFILKEKTFKGYLKVKMQRLLLVMSSAASLPIVLVIDFQIYSNKCPDRFS